MSVAFFGSSRVLLTFLDDSSGNVTAFHVKSETKAAESFNRQVKLVGRETESMVKKTMHNCGREYPKRCTELETDGIDNTISAYCTPEKNGPAKRINRTIRKTVLAKITH